MEFKLQDFWISVFPERKPDAGSSLYALSRQLYREELHIWICILPCLPIHIVWRAKYRKEKDDKKIINWIRWRLWSFRERENLKKIEVIRKAGHSHHCACRQVWGDGACNCSFKLMGTHNKSCKPTKKEIWEWAAKVSAAQPKESPK